MGHLLPLLLFTCSTSLTPGPNNMMLMSSGLNFGPKRTLPHLFGICVGFPVLVIAVGLGLGVLFDQYHWLQTLLKLVGSAYLLYLAWKISQMSTSVNTQKTTTKPITFLQAFAFQWVNPRAWISAIGIVSIFTLSQNHLINAMLMGLVYFLVFSPCGCFWLSLGFFIKRFSKNEKSFHCFNYGMGILLALSVVLIFVA